MGRAGVERDRPALGQRYRIALVATTNPKTTRKATSDCPLTRRAAAVRITILRTTPSLE